MRHSPLRHPLAILRQIIGLGQKDLGELVGRSPRTIQSIELGRHALSEELAHRIAHETGVALSWLLEANPQVQPWVHGAPKLPYQKKHFEQTRALLAAGKEPALMDLLTEQEVKDMMPQEAWESYKESWKLGEDIWSLDLTSHLQQTLASVEAASRVGRRELALHRLSEFVGKLSDEFGQAYDEVFLNRYEALLKECGMGIAGVRKSVEESGPIFWSPFISKEKWIRGGVTIVNVHFTEEDLAKWGVTEAQLHEYLPAAIVAGLPEVMNEVKRNFGEAPLPLEEKKAKPRPRVAV